MRGLRLQAQEGFMHGRLSQNFQMHEAGLSSPLGLSCEARGGFDHTTFIRTCSA